jgi:uncharacterized membrane protein
MGRQLSKKKDYILFLFFIVFFSFFVFLFFLVFLFFCFFVFFCCSYHLFFFYRQVRLLGVLVGDPVRGQPIPCWRIRRHRTVVEHELP